MKTRYYLIIVAFFLSMMTMPTIVWAQDDMNYGIEDDDDNDSDADNSDEYEDDDYGSDREFKPFKVRLKTGYASGSGVILTSQANALHKYGSATGFTGGLEAQYALTDLIHVGLGFNATLFAAVKTVEGLSGSLMQTYSGHLYGDYHFLATTIRPWVGLSLGFYNQRLVSAKLSGRIQDILSGNALQNPTFKPQSAFGIAPRVGVNLGRLALMCSYRYTFNKAVRNTLAISLGIEIGGGRY